MDRVPLLCAREIAVPRSLPRVIRVLIHYYAEEGHESKHVYLGEAKKPEGKPAYIGLMLNLEPRNGAFDLFLSADGVKQMIGVLAELELAPRGRGRALDRPGGA